VLAALDPHGAPVYAQLRVLRPRGDQPRYLNPSAGLLENPRLTRLRPTEVRCRPVLVTEGAIDALTAASAGYRAVAILGAGYPDRLVAEHLARLTGPIVLAFDPDPAGNLGSDRLAVLLAARQRPALRLPPDVGDLNDRRIATEGDWSRRLDELVAAAAPAVSVDPAMRGRGVGVA
jgi:DNA primase